MNNDRGAERGLRYREDLDEMGCQNAGCEHAGSVHVIYLHALCHTDEPPWVAYADGTIVLSCSVCNKAVARIAVASRPWTS